MATSCADHLTGILMGGGVPDAKELSAALISEFGSLPAALAGSIARKRRAGANPLALEAMANFRAAMLHALRADLTPRNVLDSTSALERYLCAKIGAEPIEEVHVFHLNTRHRLIDDQLVARGTFDSTPFYVREIVQRALELGAASLIVAHNHPSGDATPSENDVAATRALIQAAKIFSIHVHDHIIVSGGTHYSLAMNGLL